MGETRPGILRHHRDFRQLWAADALSALGVRLNMLAMPMLALFTLNASAFQVSVLRTMETLGSLLLGLLAGAWMDRIRCRGVMIAADVARAVLLGTIPLAYTLGILGLPQLYVVALCVGVCTVFFDVASTTYVPRLLDRADLIDANAKLATNTSVAAVLGSGGGGFLIQALTAPLAVAVNSLGYVWSALWLRRIRFQEPQPPRPRRPHLRREVAEGVRFVAGHRILRPLACYTACTIFFQAMHMAVDVTFLVRVIGLSPVIVGLLGMTGLFGAIAAGLATSRIAARVGTARTMWATSLIYATGFALYALTTPGWGLLWKVSGMLLISFAIVTMGVLQVSARQALTPQHLYGRVGATMEFMVWGIMPIGSLAGGIVATITDLRTTLWIVAAGVAVSILWIILSPLRTVSIDEETTQGR